ncbi:MAG TPA: hypothetical protein VK463_11875 [Desulfomonilaceae bacterium]|nr:hypothetical protein [Desulfomonilaceae bacterium]
MNKRIVATLPVAVVLILTSIAFAKGPVAAPTCMPAAPSVTTPEDRSVLSQARYVDGTYNLKLLQRRLKLTKQQKGEMRSLYTGFQDRTRDARSNLASLFKEKKDMLRSGKIDEKKLTELDDQIVKLRSDIFRDRLKLVRDRLGLLTPDQTQRLAHLKEKKICNDNLKRSHLKRAKG